MFFGGGDPFEHFAGMHGGPGGGGSSRRGPSRDVDTTKLYETLGVSHTMHFFCHFFSTDHTAINGFVCGYDKWLGLFAHQNYRGYHIMRSARRSLYTKIYDAATADMKMQMPPMNRPLNKIHIIIINDSK